MRASLNIAERDGILMLLVAGFNLLIYAKQLIYPYLQTLEWSKMDSGDYILLTINVLALILSFPMRLIVGLGLLNDAPYARRAAILAMVTGYFADLWLLYQLIPSTIYKALEFDQAHIWSLVAVIYGCAVLLYFTWRIIYDMTRPAMVEAFEELARPVFIPRETDMVPDADETDDPIEDAAVPYQPVALADLPDADPLDQPNAAVVTPIIEEAPVAAAEDASIPAGTPVIANEPPATSAPVADSAVSNTAGGND